MIIKGATMATKYAVRLAESFHLSRYTVGFIVVAVISILPETFIAINSSLSGVPSFGLGTLFGSNVADLTLVFAVIILSTGRNIKVEGNILKNRGVFPLMLFLPLILGFGGHFSRLDGLALIIAGGIFYYISLRNGGDDGDVIASDNSGRMSNSIKLLLSMTVLLVGSHFTVTSASDLASYLGVSPVLIGMLIVGLGTTMPELFFSIKAVSKRDDSMAVGDILGTVLADATIVVGILALINPFTFSENIIYVSGAFMVGASLILFIFLSTGRVLTRREAFLLLGYWGAFAIVEFWINK